MSMFGHINISLMLICGVNNESTWDRTKTILLKRETLNQSSSASSLILPLTRMSRHEWVTHYMTLDILVNGRMSGIIHVMNILINVTYMNVHEWAA